MVFELLDGFIQEILKNVMKLNEKLNDLETDYVSKELDEAALNELFEKVWSFYFFLLS